jgi:hypothetical protein
VKRESCAVCAHELGALEKIFVMIGKRLKITAFETTAFTTALLAPASRSESAAVRAAPFIERIKIYCGFGIGGAAAINPSEPRGISWITRSCRQ